MVRTDPGATPPWLAELRAKAFGISAADVGEMVGGLIARAKKGDVAALKFVLRDLLGEGRLAGATFIQNIYEPGPDGAPADDRPDRPTKARPGSPDKIERMRRRADAGLDLFAPGDGADEAGDLG